MNCSVYLKLLYTKFISLFLSVCCIVPLLCYYYYYRAFFGRVKTLHFDYTCAISYTPGLMFVRLILCLSRSLFMASDQVIQTFKHNV